MKTYCINLDINLSLFYEEIAEICKKPVEEVLQATLIKAADILTKQTTA